TVTQRTILGRARRRYERSRPTVQHERAAMDLYTYYRSTSSYRVRIALALKGLEARHIPVNLAPGHTEQRQSTYRAINPQGRVPALRSDEGVLLIQSPAILEYLEERYPQCPLLPADPLERAR